MATLHRAVKAAQRVLAEANVVRPPVDIEKLASRQAFVVKQPLEGDLSGMLVPLNEPIDGRHWAIVVNIDHPRVRQRFTIAHELGHLVLHGYKTAHADRIFKVRLRDSRSAQGSVFEEIEANRFAAEVLMPEHALLEKLQRLAWEYVEEPPSRDLERLAKEFDVSKQALSIRVSSLLT